jgi:hypothetical protein
VVSAQNFLSCRMGVVTPGNGGRHTGVRHTERGSVNQRRHRPVFDPPGKRTEQTHASKSMGPFLRLARSTQYCKFVFVCVPVPFRRGRAAYCLSSLARPTTV